MEIYDLAGRFIRFKSPVKYSIDWPADTLAFLIRIILGAMTCVAVNLATPHLSIPAALLIGVTAPLLLAHLGSFYRPEVGYEEREDRINFEAERLADMRQSLTAPASPHGVSTDVADILDARREALAGQLPVIEPHDERRASS
jgi:hypothetical protein